VMRGLIDRFQLENLTLSDSDRNYYREKAEVRRKKYVDSPRQK
jgi:hypothetical protein